MPGFVNTSAIMVLNLGMIGTHLVLDTVDFLVLIVQIRDGDVGTVAAITELFRGI